jgi:hypothetical protein
MPFDAKPCETLIQDACEVVRVAGGCHHQRPALDAGEEYGGFFFGVDIFRCLAGGLQCLDASGQSGLPAVVEVANDLHHAIRAAVELQAGRHVHGKVVIDLWPQADPDTIAEPYWARHHYQKDRARPYALSAITKHVLEMRRDRPATLGFTGPYSSLALSRALMRNATSTRLEVRLRAWS